MNAATLNARDLELELAWFTQLLEWRFEHQFGDRRSIDSVHDLMQLVKEKLPASQAQVSDSTWLQPPNLLNASMHSNEAAVSNYARFVERYQLNFYERVALVLSLTPYLRPKLLDLFFIRNKTFDKRFTEFGGVLGDDEGHFIPTVETLIFLLAGSDLALRFQLLTLFQAEHFFNKHNILHLSYDQGETVLKAPLRLADDFIAQFTLGSASGPAFGMQFPAQRIDTQLDWQDLVLHPSTEKQIGEIKTWIKHGATLLNDWGMGKRLRPGYRCLFYGPPGTGKSISACLLGKIAHRDVYKIDLSMVVSKYIGETEKNLAQIFSQAQNKDWILFFDEADALFGKRTETKSAHDRHANQEVSFLLQRIETFDGIVILASNFRDNLDEAFTRRFESIVYFPMPRPQERLRLWQQSIPAQAGLDDCVDLRRIATDYALSGGEVINVVRKVALTVLDEGQRVITQDDLVNGIKQEYAKERKAV